MKALIMPRCVVNALNTHAINEVKTHSIKKVLHMIHVHAFTTAVKFEYKFKF